MKSVGSSWELDMDIGICLVCDLIVRLNPKQIACPTIGIETKTYELTQIYFVDSILYGLQPLIWYQAQAPLQKLQHKSRFFNPRNPSPQSVVPGTFFLRLRGGAN